MAGTLTTSERAVALPDFVARLTSTRDPARTARAARLLLDGAQRLQRGDDIHGDPVERPVSKPIEAIGAWLGALEHDGNRPAEMRLALVAAAEEVDAAPESNVRAARLKDALYADALAALGKPPVWQAAWFWPAVAALAAGVALGTMYARRRR